MRDLIQTKRLILFPNQRPIHIRSWGKDLPRAVRFRVPMIFRDHRGNVFVIPRIEKAFAVMGVAHEKAGSVRSVKMRIFGIFEIPSINPFPYAVNVFREDRIEFRTNTIKMQFSDHARTVTGIQRGILIAFRLYRYFKRSECICQWNVAAKQDTENFGVCKAHAHKLIVVCALYVVFNVFIAITVKKAYFIQTTSVQDMEAP